MSATPTRLPFAAMGRVTLAVVLGVLVGSYTSSALTVGEGLFAVGFILIPPLLSLLLDPGINRKGAAVVPLLLGLLGLLATLAIVGAVLTQPPVTRARVTMDVVSMEELGAVLLLSGVVAFSLGRVDADGHPISGHALTCALGAWLGFGIRALAGVSSSLSSGNDFGGMLMFSMTALFMLGFILCAVEGVLGIKLRGWLVRRARHPSDAAWLARHG